MSLPPASASYERASQQSISQTMWQPPIWLIAYCTPEHNGCRGYQHSHRPPRSIKFTEIHSIGYLFCPKENDNLHICGPTIPPLQQRLRNTHARFWYRTVQAVKLPSHLRLAHRHAAKQTVKHRPPTVQYNAIPPPGHLPQYILKISVLCNNYLEL